MADDLISLVQGCIAGDKGSWDIFVRDFSRTAMNILNSKFHNLGVDRKEDIIQNVFIKLIQGGLKNFCGTSKYEFLAYFKTIVWNEASTYCSSEKRKNNTISLNQEKEGEDGELLQHEIAGDDPAPDVIAEGKQSMEKVISITKEYPLQDQQIFWMKIDGEKDKDIADMLGMPMGTVAAKYSRMKEKLRQILGE